MMMGSSAGRGPGSKFTYANVVASLALFLVVSGGAAFAAGLKKNSVKSKHVVDGSLTGKDIKNNSLTDADIENLSLTGNLFKDRSLTGKQIRKKTIDGAEHIIDQSIDGAQIGRFEIGPNHLVIGPVIGTEKVFDGSLLGADIKDGSLTGTEIANNTLFGHHIVNDSLTGADIAIRSLSNVHLIRDSITGDEVLNNSLTGDDIDESTLSLPGGGAPTGPAGGALDGTYPNPELAPTVQPRIIGERSGATVALTGTYDERIDQSISLPANSVWTLALNASVNVNAGEVSTVSCRFDVGDAEFTAHPSTTTVPAGGFMAIPLTGLYIRDTSTGPTSVLVTVECRVENPGDPAAFKGGYMTITAVPGNWFPPPAP